MANGAVTSMVRTLAVELAPVRVNAIHPGAVGDSPAVKAMPSADDRGRSGAHTNRPHGDRWPMLRQPRFRCSIIPIMG